MAEASNAPSNVPQDRAVSRAGRLGRRVSIAIYLVGVAFMVVVGFHSITRQVFFGSADDDAMQSDAGQSCETVIASLHESLVAETGRHVTEVGRGQDPDHAYFDAWDRRFSALRERCDDPAMGPLLRARYRLQTTLRRFDREDGRLLERVRRELDRSADDESSEI